MIYVRRVIASDVPDVMAMAKRFHLESPLHNGFTFDTQKVRDLIAGAMASPDWLSLVAIDDEGLVGMAMVYCLPAYFSQDRECCDLAFYVDPTKRGGRAAILMAQEIVGWADLRGAKRITIGIHTGINHASAARFFGKLGFEPSGLLLAR